MYNTYSIYFLIVIRKSTHTLKSNHLLMNKSCAVIQTYERQALYECIKSSKKKTTIYTNV